MSVENARAFYERLMSDEVFRLQFQDAPSDRDRLNLVLAAGYHFTPQEWESALKEIFKSSVNELSDDELSHVNGGAIKIPHWLMTISVKLPPTFPKPIEL
jgi:predicted ribosomally synthesized peptide with nif11-like leader